MGLLEWWVMREVRCRNCGAIIELPRFHGATLIECPECSWQEIIPARRKLSKDLDQQAGTAFQQLRLKQGKMKRLADRVVELSAGEFQRLCEDVLGGMGHEVLGPDVMQEQVHDFELTVEDERVLVSCRRHSPRHTVANEEIENLAGAMRHASAPRGIYITVGKFDKAGFELAREAKINLIDGATLKKMIIALDPEAMRSWWEEEEGGFELEEPAEALPGPETESGQSADQQADRSE